MRDKLGRITQKTETLQGTTTVYDYGYDAAGRLETVKENTTLVRRYTYDANGNRLSSDPASTTPIAAYDAQDRLTSYGAASYTHTAHGERATRTVGANTTTTTYDTLGALRAVALPGGTNLTYVIDGRNRRIGKKVGGTLTQAWLYQDGLNPVAELDGAGNLVSRFVYATRPHVPDTVVKGGVTYRILSDHLGSVRLVVNASTGAVAQRIDYDEFGRVLSDSNPGFQPFGFAGGLYDPDTGLTRFGARDYDPEVGHWTAKDPIRFDGGDPNLYGYVVGDPVNAIDPAGEALILNTSGKPVRTSRNRSGGGGQQIYTIPGYGTSGLHDADTIIADDGSVIKVNTDDIVLITDPSSTESFDLSTDIPGPFLGDRFIPNPQAEFGPFYDEDGTKVGNPQPVCP